MGVREDLLNKIRALPLAEQQALLDELTASVKGAARDDDAQLHKQLPQHEKAIGETDADRVLGMWRHRFDDAETSDEIADRWRHELWQR